MTTPYSPEIPHLTAIGTLLKSHNDPGSDLVINYNQTTKCHMEYMSKIYFTNGIIKPVCMRSNPLLKASEFNIQTFDSNLSWNDSRLIYERHKLSKIDYLVYFMNNYGYLENNITIHARGGYSADNHFSEILNKINMTGLLDKFNKLNDFEKKCFAAVLISEINPALLDILDLYEINNLDTSHQNDFDIA